MREHEDYFSMCGTIKKIEDGTLCINAAPMKHARVYLDIPLEEILEDYSNEALILEINEETYFGTFETTKNGNLVFNQSNDKPLSLGDLFDAHVGKNFNATSLLAKHRAKESPNNAKYLIVFENLFHHK